MNQIIDDRKMTVVWIVVLTTILFLFCQHPPRKGVLKYMAEAIISRRGENNRGPLLKTETIISNREWIVPAAINNEFSIMIFGGGGGGTTVTDESADYLMGSGGGGGWMNTETLTLRENSSIYITIGTGGETKVGYDYGMIGNSGGTTSFGGYLSANGGEGATYNKGGNGGSGGGVGCRLYDDSPGRGGTGYQFGGGGSRAGGGIRYIVSDPNYKYEFNFFLIEIVEEEVMVVHGVEEEVVELKPLLISICQTKLLVCKK